jgi:mono/diheme cytochrome c family protein
MTAPRRALASALATLVFAGCSPSNFTEPLVLGGRSVDPALLNKGQGLFNRYCATCHGYDGKADTPQARQLQPAPRDFTAAKFKHHAAAPDGLPTDAELQRVITNGVPGTGMPAWPNLKGEELDAVTQYLKTFSPAWRSTSNAPGK